MVWYGMVWYDIWNDMHGMIYGMVCYDMGIWCDMVWYGMV